MAGDDSDQRLVAELEALIAMSKREDFPAVEQAILDRLKAKGSKPGEDLSSLAAYRLLRRARADLLGQNGPGLSRVTRAGELEPIGPGMPAPKTAGDISTVPQASTERPLAGPQEGD